MYRAYCVRKVWEQIFNIPLSYLNRGRRQTLGQYNILGIRDGKTLQRVVFFYIGKVFCIRGRIEQCSFGPSQFVHSRDPDCYTYTEDGSENHSGGAS